jgi:hypothetical protein
MGTVMGGGGGVWPIVQTTPFGDLPGSPTNTTAKNSGSSGGGGSTSVPKSYIEAFYDWMGRNPSAGEKSRIAKEGWTETTIRQYAIDTNSWGNAHKIAYGAVLQIAANFYGGDPSLVPQSIVDALIRNGTYTDANYLTNQYFPTLKGAGLTNPLSQPFVDSWVEMTGKAPTADAIAQLDKLVRTYGFTDNAKTAFDHQRCYHWQLWCY